MASNTANFVSSYWGMGADMKQTAGAEVEVFTNQCNKCGMVYKTIDHPWTTCHHCGATGDALSFFYKGQPYKNVADLENSKLKFFSATPVLGWDSKSAGLGYWHSYLASRSVNDVWMVFKLNEEGNFLALYSPKQTTFEWSTNFVTPVQTEDTASYLAHACGGFVVHPFQKDCPVRVDWPAWVKGLLENKFPGGMASAQYVILD